MGRYLQPTTWRVCTAFSGHGRDRPSHRPVPSVKQKQTRLTDSDQAEVLERYLAGETANALAEAFDVNRATIFAILQRAVIKSRAIRILTDCDVAAAIAMYEAGRSPGFDRDALRRSRPDRPACLPSSRRHRTSRRLIRNRPPRSLVRQTNYARYRPAKYEASSATAMQHDPEVCEAPQ